MPLSNIRKDIKRNDAMIKLLLSKSRHNSQGNFYKKNVKKFLHFLTTWEAFRKDYGSGENRCSDRSIEVSLPVLVENYDSQTRPTDQPTSRRTD